MLVTAAETIVVEAPTLNTAEEADRMVALAYARPLVLVTSASHARPSSCSRHAASRWSRRHPCRKVERSVYESLARLKPGS